MFVDFPFLFRKSESSVSALHIVIKTKMNWNLFNNFEFWVVTPKSTEYTLFSEMIYSDRRIETSPHFVLNLCVLCNGRVKARNKNQITFCSSCSIHFTFRQLRYQYLTMHTQRMSFLSCCWILCRKSVIDFRFGNVTFWSLWAELYMAQNEHIMGYLCWSPNLLGVFRWISG